MSAKPIDRTGTKLWRLTVVRRSDRGKWVWRCECGAEVITDYHHVAVGHTKSCGCLKAEMHATRFIRHGQARAGKLTKLYVTYRSMVNRCQQPGCKQFPLYGGRGIKICSRWLDSFENFAADMGEPPTPKHELDRRDNDGNYEPGNCRWATRKEQMRNTGATRWITFKGRTLNLSAWAEEIGMLPSSLESRLRKGWSIERALTEPYSARHNTTKGVTP